jgi:hypothetical protein
MTDPFDDGKDTDFGSVYPEGHVPGEDHVPIHKDNRDRPKAMGAALHGPAERWAQDRFPGCAWGKLEGYRYVGGRYVKTDFEGFADFQLSHEGRRVFVQVTTQSSVSAHMTKYRTGRWGTNGKPIRDYIRKWLNVGDMFVILGFEKVGSRWVANETWVTSDMLKKKGEK